MEKQKIKNTTPLRKVYEDKLNILVDMYFKQITTGKDSEHVNNLIYNDLNTMWKQDVSKANTIHKGLKANYKAFELLVAHMEAEATKEQERGGDARTTHGGGVE